MSERLEKLYTLTDVDNPPEAPVTIEAGGLIKDNQTGRVIARMYLKNCSEKPLSSVLVGFRPKGENGKTISGMRDYLYDATGIPVGEIFGDQTGILFDNNETRSFSADVEGVDFEDGEFWDAAEAREKAEELKLIVPEEKEPKEPAPEMWEKPVEQTKAPEVWESDDHSDEPHSAEIYGAAVVEQTFESPAEEEFIPASMQTRQLAHEDRAALEEETDAFRDEKAKAVIELDGPTDDEGPVIELGGPVTEEPEVAEPEPEVETPVEPEPEELAAEETDETPEEPETEPEAVVLEEPETVEAEPAEEEPAVEEPVEEEPAIEEEPVEEEPQGPVRLADMYGGAAAIGGSLASYAAAYAMREKAPEKSEYIPVAAAEPAEAPEVEPAEVEVPEPVEEPVQEEPAEAVEEPAPEIEAEPEAVEVAEAPVEEPVAVEAAYEAPVAEEPVIEPEAVEEPAPVEVASKIPETPEEVKVAPEAPEAVVVPEAPEAAYEVPAEPAPVEAPVVEEIPEPEVEVEPERPVIEPIPKEESPWAGYSSDYAAPLGTMEREPAEEVKAEFAQGSIEEVQLEPEEEVLEEAPVALEPETTEAAQESAEAAPEAEPAVQEPEEHIPTIEETIELPKAEVAEKSEEDAAKIMEAAAAKTEPEEASSETEEAPEEVKAEQPAAAKADVVFAQEPETLPTIVGDDNEKALTGEDHSGRNLLNIIVFGGIALIILLVLLIKM